MSYLIEKLCPFCGGAASLWTRGARYGAITYVQCDVCGAQTKAFPYHGDAHFVDEKQLGCQRALEAWDRRTEVNG